MKILCVGDAHFKLDLGYADMFEDRRIEEKTEILDFIVNESKDCETVVFLGDQLDKRNNHSSVIKEFINFIERFDKKELYILLGNHESVYGERTAIDFMKEIKNKSWHVVTNKVETIGKYTFCPYFFKGQLKSETNEEASKKLMKELSGGDSLFVHHALSDSSTSSGMSTNIFDEIVLPRKELEKRYKLVVAGHVHSPSLSTNNKTIVSGSIFNQEVGETQKYIWKVDSETFKIEQIKLPGRPIYKQENPTLKDLDKLEKNSIVKVILTKKYEDDELEEIQEKLKEFDAHIIIEDIPTQRKKMIVGGVSNILDLSLDQLLEAYAKERNIEYSKLIMGFDLIR